MTNLKHVHYTQRKSCKTNILSAHLGVVL